MLTVPTELVAALIYASAFAFAFVRSHRRGCQNDLARRVALMELAEERHTASLAALRA